MDKKGTKSKRKSKTAKPANMKVTIRFASKQALTKVLKEGMKQYKNTLKELAKS